MDQAYKPIRAHASLRLCYKTKDNFGGRIPQVSHKAIPLIHVPILKQGSLLTATRKNIFVVICKSIQ